MILKEKIKETDLIFFQSGYTFTGIHPYENMHRKIVENFPYNKIVFLPQTVKFKNQKILENVQNFYGKYDNIYFLHGIKFRMIFINQFFLSIGTSIVFLI